MLQHPSDNPNPLFLSHLDDPAFSPDPRNHPDYITSRQLSPPPPGHPVLKSKSSAVLSPDGNIIAEQPFQPPPPPNSPVTPAASPQPPFTPFPVALAAITEYRSPSPESIPDDLVFEPVLILPMPNQPQPTPPAKKGLKLLSRFRSIQGSDNQPSRRVARTLSIIHESRPDAGPRHASAPETAQFGRPPQPTRAATLGGGAPSNAPSRLAKNAKLRGHGLDRVDEMDATNPWGISLHHDGPYEAAVQAMKAKRPPSLGIPEIPYSQHPLLANDVPYIPPQVPIGVSIKLSPGQILPRNFNVNSTQGSTPFARWDEGASPKPPIQRNSMLIPNRSSQLYQLPPQDPSPPRHFDNAPPVTAPLPPQAPLPPRAPQVPPSPSVTDRPAVIIEGPEESTTQLNGPSIDIGLAMLENSDPDEPTTPDPSTATPARPVRPDEEFNPYDPSHIEDHHGSTSALSLSTSNSVDSASRQPAPPQRIVAPALKTVQFSDSVEVLEDPPAYTHIDTSAPTSRSISPLPPVDGSTVRDRSPLPHTHLGHRSPPNHNDVLSSSSNAPEFIRAPNAGGALVPATGSMTSSPWMEPQSHKTQSQLPGAWNGEPLTGQMDNRPGLPPQEMPPLQRDQAPSRSPPRDTLHDRGTPPMHQTPPQQHRPQSTIGGTPPQRPSPPRSMMTGDSRSTHHSVSSSQYSGKPPPRRPVPKHLVMPAPLNPAAASNRMNRVSQPILSPPNGYPSGPSSIPPLSNSNPALLPPSSSSFSTSAANAYYAQRRVSQPVPITPQGHSFAPPAHTHVPRAQEIPIAASNKLKKRVSVVGPVTAPSPPPAPVPRPQQQHPHPQHQYQPRYPPPQHHQYHNHQMQHPPLPPHHQLPPNGVPIVAGGPQNSSITTVSFKPTVIDYQAPLPLEKMLGRAKTERIPKRVLSKRKTGF